MKWKLLTICLLGVASAAYAQTASQPAANKTDTYKRTWLGPVATAPATAPTTAQVSSGDPDDPEGESGPPPAPEPVPENPKTGKFENGRIVIEVESNRHFGYHIGDVIPLQITIQTDKDVLFDFNALKQGTLKTKDSGFTVVPGSELTVHTVNSTKHPQMVAYVIDMQVQWLRQLTPSLTFNVDLSYALDPPKDRKKIKWTMLTTPDFLVSTTTLVDNGKHVQQGDLGLAQVRISWATLPLLVIGLFTIVWFGGLKDLVRWLNRLRIAAKAPAEIQAWRVFNKVFADAAEYKQFTPIYAQKVATALRKYFGVQSQTLVQIQTGTAMSNESLVVALQTCQKVIYARVDEPVVLGDEEVAQLKQQVTRLVAKEPVVKPKEGGEKK